MFFSKPAQFIIIDAQGLPVTQKIDVWIGYSYEAFVLVPTDIGDAINACGDAIKARSKDQECELTFYHDSQHFSPSGLPCLVTKSVNRASPNLESASYPRLKIPQNLPCQSTLILALLHYIFLALHIQLHWMGRRMVSFVGIQLFFVAYLLQHGFRYNRERPCAD